MPSAGALAPLAATHRMQWRERLQRTLDLWPYMAPLTLVYFAEYVLQVQLLQRHSLDYNHYYYTPGAYSSC